MRHHISDADAATMLVDDFFDDGEAEPRSFRLGGDVRLKNSQHYIFAYAATVIGDNQVDSIILRAGGNRYARLGCAAAESSI